MAPTTKQKEFFARTHSRLRRRAWWVTGLATVGAYTYTWRAAVARELLTWTPGAAPLPPDPLVKWSHILAGLLAVAPLLLAAPMFASPFTIERENGTLEALCLTLYPRRHVISGLMGVIWQPVICLHVLLLPLVILLPRDASYVAGSSGRVYAFCPGLPMCVTADILSAPFWTGSGLGGTNAVSVLLGAMQWLVLLLRLWALSWISAVFSLRARNRLRAAVSACLVAVLLCTGEVGIVLGLPYLVDLPDATMLVLVLGIGEVGFLLLLTLRIRRLLPHRFDEWVTQD